MEAFWFWSKFVLGIVAVFVLSWWFVSAIDEAQRNLNKKNNASINQCIKVEGKPVLVNDGSGPPHIECRPIGYKEGE